VKSKHEIGKMSYDAVWLMYLLLAGNDTADLRVAWQRYALFQVPYSYFCNARI